MIEVLQRAPDNQACYSGVGEGYVMTEIRAGPNRRIRGSYRRRLLDHLSDGPSTVSVAGKAVGLRLPHASAELKRMREEGYVQSDSDSSQRGATQHLTAAGWELLTSDELARLESINIDGIPEWASGILLAKDGPQLLIAYTKLLRNSLIPLPRSGESPYVEGSGDYSGNEGVKSEWLWSVAREAEVRWYDIENLQPTTPPKDEQTASLTDWVEDTPKIGLLRARLLDPRQSLRLAIGSWFGEPIESEWPNLPMPMGSSESWRLGVAHESVPPLSSQCPICAILPDRLSTTSLLASSSEGAMVIAEASLLGREGDSLPLSILESWIIRAHPRLSEAERKHRLEGLLEAIQKGRKTRSGTTRVEDSTWRKFQSDWPNREWSDLSGEESTLLDVQGMSNNAWLSLIDWSINRDINTPVVMQYPPNHYDSHQIHTLFSDHRTRLVILNNEPDEVLAYPTLRPDPIRPHSWFRLQLAGDVELACKVSSKPPPSFTSPPPSWQAPRNYTELLDSVEVAIEAAGDSSPPEASSESSAEMLLFAAVLRYPLGDSDWSNRIESTDPLAAWIACPEENRWPMWMRQGENIGEKWLELLSHESVPIENLPEIAGHAPLKWQDDAMKYLAKRIQEEYDLSLRLRTLVESQSLDNAASAWLASTLLSQVAWLPTELTTDLAKWGPKSIAKSPPKNIIPSLCGLNWLTQQGKLETNWSELLNYSTTESKTLSGWQALVAIANDGREPSIEDVENITALPIEWWAPFSPNLFIKMTELSEGREKLLSGEIPWAAALFRPPGEEHIIPGSGVINHPGCPAELIVRLERILHGVERDSNLIGVNELSDLQNALLAVSKNNAPHTGNIHPLIGWLLQPIDKWPEFTASEITFGDPEVSVRLAARKSGFHKGLRAKTQRRL